ncbi:hypothetical protein LTR91_011977 [Friedmanniomyces endolithicus]|uniref:Uncharacterized protein n=1 Tax=Friedmanniomyces endolithicus TaxID=329885 RepID=A0AAN6KG98_9PEZI|nr:hypothetical protein LTR57_014177 [Friedmanniomyces endolithicus]KAK0953368.1 hypothetical protein LTS01_024411 [Friedmanniomyces endolithicus]KAK0981121.1 hypothetical protein LTR91_011977 [Friedmanniomyces endolithicus]KAK1021971.1 hypothetical protein LTS16_026096 [Friedmanniomyces endolithicus]
MPVSMAGLNKEPQDPVVVSSRLTVPLPIFKALTLISSFMSTQPNPPAKRRGRRAGVKVPCDDCIARASQIHDKNANIELCDICTAVLHGQRKKPPTEAANVRRVRRQSNAIIDVALGSSSTDPITLPWSDDRHEQHALQFFVRNSAPQLAGYFDSPFWQRMVLQAARGEPAVKHAVAAIGSLHEKLLTGAVNNPETDLREPRARFALEQCNKSIQHLIAWGGRERPGFAVDADYLRAVYGHCEQAITHATQGYSLLQQYAMDPGDERWDVGAFAIELDQLCMLMQRLQTQSKGLMGKEFRVSPAKDMFNTQRPVHFSSLTEARSGLELVLNQLTIFFMDLELDDEFYDMAVSNAEKHLLFGPWLEDWEKAFSAFLLQQQASFDDRDRKAAMILKAHHLVGEILAQVDLSLGELGWDAFRPQFAAIVDLATAVLEDSNKSDVSVIEARWKTGGVFISSTSATLSFTLGIVDPLFEVCSRCRDPVLRRKALDLLARHPRQECMWSSWSAWKVGKFILRLEEDGADSPVKQSSDVPLNSRVTESWLDFSDKSSADSARGRVMYKKAIPRVTPRSALNPGLFEGQTSEESGVFTGMADAGVLPTDLELEEGSSATGTWATRPELQRWADFDTDWQASGAEGYQGYSLQE